MGPTTHRRPWGHHARADRQRDWADTKSVPFWVSSPARWPSRWGPTSVAGGSSAPSVRAWRSIDSRRAWPPRARRPRSSSPPATSASPCPPPMWPPAPFSARGSAAAPRSVGGRRADGPRLARHLPGGRSGRCPHLVCRPRRRRASRRPSSCAPSSSAWRPGCGCARGDPRSTTPMSTPSGRRRHRPHPPTRFPSTERVGREQPRLCPQRCLAGPARRAPPRRRSARRLRARDPVSGIRGRWRRRGQPGPAAPLGRLLAVLCFALVLTGVAVGITYIVASGWQDDLLRAHLPRHRPQVLTSSARYGSALGAWPFGRPNTPPVAGAARGTCRSGHSGPEWTNPLPRTAGGPVSNEAPENLLHEDRSFPPDPAFSAAANGQPELYAAADADHEGFWADQARKYVSWATRSARSSTGRMPLRDVVRRRHAQCVIQLPGPARRGRARRQGGYPLRRRARRHPDGHLCRPAPRGAGRQR